MKHYGGGKTLSRVYIYIFEYATEMYGEHAAHFVSIIYGMEAKRISSV